MFGWFLRWSCDARQLAALQRVRKTALRFRRLHRDEERLAEDLLGDGVSGPMSLDFLVLMSAAFRVRAVPIRRERSLARRDLAHALATCRALGLGRWQVRLALR